jgi:hypothetical protein
VFIFNWTIPGYCNCTTPGYVGFYLSIKDVLPDGDAFIFDTFEDLDTVVNSKPCVSYGHCIVANPAKVEAPSFVDIEWRWQYITKTSLPFIAKH